jgi:hypothetical protein
VWRPATVNKSLCKEFCKVNVIFSVCILVFVRSQAAKYKAAQHVPRVRRAWRDVQVQVQFFLECCERQLTVCGYRYVEIKDNEAVSVTIAGPRELAPVVEICKEMFPSRVTAIWWWQKHSNTIVYKSFEEEQGSLVVFQKALYFQ